MPHWYRSAPYRCVSARQDRAEEGADSADRQEGDRDADPDDGTRYEPPVPSAEQPHGVVELEVGDQVAAVGRFQPGPPRGIPDRPSDQANAIGDVDAARD